MNPQMSSNAIKIIDIMTCNIVRGWLGECSGWQPDTGDKVSSRDTPVPCLAITTRETK